MPIILFHEAKHTVKLFLGYMLKYGFMYKVTQYTSNSHCYRRKSLVNSSQKAEPCPHILWGSELHGTLATKSQAVKAWDKFIVFFLSIDRN